MMLWQRRTANTIRTLLQQLKYNDVHVDLEDESGPAAEISEAKSTWEENCHGKVVCVCLCWQASKHKGKRSSKAWHAVVTSFWAAMFISICHRQ